MKTSSSDSPSSFAELRAPQPESHVVARNEYGVFHIPAESIQRPAAQAIIAGGVWEADVAALIAERARDGSVVTAGAYFGDMLPAAARGGNTVFAAEPNPVNFAAATATLKANGIDNVRLFNCALGARPGTVRLQVMDVAGTALGGGSWIVPRRKPWRKRGTFVTSDVRTIDEIVPDDSRIVLVHLDIERYEAHALLGAAQTLERCRPELLLETRPRFGRAARLLSELGYRPVAVLDGNVLLRTA